MPQITVLPRDTDHLTDFSVGFSRRNRYVVVEVSGDLDFDTAPLLARCLIDVIVDQGNLSVILDLAEVTYLDHAGAKCIDGARRELLSRGGEFQVSRPSPAALRGLRSESLDLLLTIVAA